MDDNRDFLILGLVALAIWLANRGGRGSFARTRSYAPPTTRTTPIASGTTENAAGTGGYGMSGSPGSVPLPSQTCGGGCGCDGDPMAGLIPAPIGDYTSGGY